MENKQVEAIIRQYLPQVIHMSLATVGEGRPWVCELHFAVDDGLNVYWASAQQRRHSEEVLANPFVSGSMATQHHLEQLVRGVSFEGQAEMVAAISADDPGYKVYAGRFPDRAPGLLESYQKPDGARLYKITVSDWYLVDGYIKKSPFADKHHLSWNK